MKSCKFYLCLFVQCCPISIMFRFFNMYMVLFWVSSFVITFYFSRIPKFYCLLLSFASLPNILSTLLSKTLLSSLRSSTFPRLLFTCAFKPPAFNYSVASYLNQQVSDAFSVFSPKEGKPLFDNDYNDFISLFLLLGAKSSLLFSA